MKKISIYILLAMLVIYAPVRSQSPVIIYKAIDVTKDSIVKKDTIKALEVVAVQSAEKVKAQKDTIAKQEKKISNLEKSIEENLLMGKPFSFYFWFMFFYLWGILIWWLVYAAKGTITNKQTPKKLNLKYWIQQPENKSKLSTAILVLFVGFFIAAFCKPITGKEINEFLVPYQFLAISFGFSWQLVLDLTLSKLNAKNYIKIEETKTN